MTWNSNKNFLLIQCDIVKAQYLTYLHIQSCTEKSTGALKLRRKIISDNLHFLLSSTGLIRSSYNFSFFLEGGGCKWNWIIYGLKTVRKFSTKSIVKTTRYPKEPDRTCVPTEKILINALVAGKPLCKASIAVIVITGLRENLIIGENIVPSCHLVFVSSPEREGESPEPTGDQYNQSASEYIISRRKGALRTLFGESQ